MDKIDVPFNIFFLKLDESTIKYLKPVTSLDVFDGITKNLHPEGLYSPTIFGVVGSNSRYTKFSYIDIRLQVMHPVYYKAITAMKTLYEGIMTSKEFAVWDEETKDFIKSNALDGKTGYDFFIEHHNKIEHEQRPSIDRQENISLINKYKDYHLYDKIIVLPAAYRDIEIDDSGRESSDEINSLYYKILAISNTINPHTVKISPEAYNTQRMSLQRSFNEVYDYIANIIRGKNNLFMGKWASRKIFNGTRNVISSMNITQPELGGENSIKYNDTVVGLYQTLKGLLPVSLHRIKTGFLSEVFASVGAPALLTNKTTLKSERVILKSNHYDKWMTTEGIESLISSYKEPSIRHDYITVDNYYLGLIYRGPDKTFKLIHGIDELPEDRDPKDCRPISLTELFYCAMYEVANDYPALVTRYPITGVGSVYPSNVKLKSTIDAEIRKKLNQNWEVDTSAKVAYEFPTQSDLFGALSPHPFKLQNLGADYDGDGY
jgi:DNA-directed RNA polymerase beta' subunit